MRGQWSTGEPDWAAGRAGGGAAHSSWAEGGGDGWGRSAMAADCGGLLGSRRDSYRGQGAAGVVAGIVGRGDGAAGGFGDPHGRGAKAERLLIMGIGLCGAVFFEHHV